jgi:hypothetical protein
VPEGDPAELTLEPTAMGLVEFVKAVLGELVIVRLHSRTPLVYNFKTPDDEL